MYRRLGSRSPADGIGAGSRSTMAVVKTSLAKLFFQIKSFKVIILTSLVMFALCSVLLSPSSIAAQLEALGSHPLYYSSGLKSNNATSDSLYKMYMESPPRINKKNFNSIEKRLKYFFPYDGETDVENNIWQLWKYRADNEKFPQKCFEHMERWRVGNSEYNHNLITLDEAEQQIFDHFSYDMPEVIEAYSSLPDIRLKFDFLKYLIIFTNGGVYADIDTLDAMPLRFWYKSTLKPSRMMVGINVDYNDVNWDNLYNRRLTFSTTIIKAKSHHPFFAKLIARIIYTALNSREEIDSIDWDKAYQNVDSNDEPLIQFTSESIFTDTLFDYFNELNNPIVHRVARTDKDLIPEQIFGPEVNQVFSYKLFTLARGPTQIDDVVVMPQISFKGPKSGLHRGNNNVQSYESEYQDDKQDGLYYARPLHFLSWDSLTTE
jgi:alpha 1,6-mannosyltransferase